MYENQKLKPGTVVSSARPPVRLRDPAAVSYAFAADVKAGQAGRVLLCRGPALVCRHLSAEGWAGAWSAAC